MKKIIKIISKTLVISTLICSCEKSDVDLSEVTYLPMITVNGEKNIDLDCAVTTYEDAGAIASVNGVEIELITTVEGTYFGGIEVDGPDAYTITYSALNDDNIPGADFREVVLPPCNGDFVTSIAGVYEANVDRNSGGEVYEGLSPVYIKDLGDGAFQISDAIGGFYEYGRGFGSDYAATGMTVVANDFSTNDFSFSDVIGVGLFGGELSMTSFEIDVDNKTISFVTDWDAGFVFEVELTQIEQ